MGNIDCTDKRGTTIVQADREAAAALYQQFPSLSTSRAEASKTAEFVRSGGGDGWTTVQAFARHRQRFSANTARRPINAYESGAKVLGAIKEVLEYGGSRERAVANGEAALRDLRRSTAEINPPWRRGEGVMEWRTIDSAPKDGTPILVGWRGGSVGSATWWRDGWALIGSLQNNLKPTHWMSLPAPPTP